MGGTILYILGSADGFQEFMYPLINKVGPPATPELPPANDWPYRAGAMAGGYHVTYNSITGWVSGTYVQVNP